ncbi:MAG: hypothetical protein ONB44_01860 [candidate division KSB1 bacterium]|nr:hypothetical protein [candidate division KSB1 bacterium]MDZ7300867.1 hypothetical protein [candidate division KSB1 bacterium]MDZ7309863.1 hypothetical protein [candidate division KSB1 bacterium]
MEKIIRHPEIVVGNELIVTLDEYGKTIMTAPEAGASIEFLEAVVLIPEQKIICNSGSS